MKFGHKSAAVAPEREARAPGSSRTSLVSSSVSVSFGTVFMRGG
jgi:hypothetical protein